MAYLNNLQEIYKIRINDLEFDGIELTATHIVQSKEDKYFVNLDGQQIPVRVIASDEPRRYRFVIDQQSYTATLIRNIDARVEAMNFSKRLNINAETILAPMPGLVKKVFVSTGDDVVKGQHLLTLEAMKMENIIKSPHTGKIKTIPVIAGTPVEKNQVLITF